MKHGIQIVTWKVQFVRKSDFFIISRLDYDTLNELNKYFDSVTDVFDKINNSVYCSSIIYHVPEHNISINYHIDNEDEIIRITSIDKI